MAEQISKAEAQGMLVDYSFTGMNILTHYASGVLTWHIKPIDGEFPYQIGGTAHHHLTPGPDNMETALQLIQLSARIVRWAK